MTKRVPDAARPELDVRPVDRLGGAALEDKCARREALARLSRSRGYFGDSGGLRRESNRSPLAGCFLKAHFS
jgi:hypothetical protein